MNLRKWASIEYWSISSFLEVQEMNTEAAQPSGLCAMFLLLFPSKRPHVQNDKRRQVSEEANDETGPPRHFLVRFCLCVLIVSFHCNGQWPHNHGQTLKYGAIY